MAAHIQEIIRKNKPAIAIILGLFVVATIISWIGPITSDGCSHFFVGKYISEHREIPVNQPLEGGGFFSPPFLFHLVIATFYVISRTLHISLLFLILPLCYAGTLTFTYMLAKDEWNKKIALIAILLLGTIPLFLDSFANYFVDGFLTFLVTASIFYAVRNRVAFSGLFFGLAIFTKANGAFILPCLLYLIYRNNKIRFKPYIMFFVSGLVGLIPYIRNYLLFKNPVYPFLSSFFGGLPIVWTRQHVGLLTIVKSLFLQVFGVPAGLEYPIRVIRLFIGIDITYMVYVMLVFFGIAILVPILISLKQAIKAYYFVWISCFLVFVLIFLLEVGNVLMRYALPCFPALAIMFAVGFNHLASKSRNLRQTMLVALALLIVVFVLTVFLKHLIAVWSFHQFQPDFDFIKNNTGKDVILYYNGGCISMRTDRYSLFFNPIRPEKFRSNSIIYLNKNMFAEPFASIPVAQQEKIIRQTNCTIIYSNLQTKTSLCKIA
jgi:4-amino-4-deoxy-L-arabinose transferase-like glycosyltransferase